MKLTEGKWIFESFERRWSRLFVVPVEKRDRDTLKSNSRIFWSGKTIMSDQWRAYQTLNHLGFHHFTVNHSYNFVDPDSGIISIFCHWFVHTLKILKGSGENLEVTSRVMVLDRTMSQDTRVLIRSSVMFTRRFARSNLPYS